MLSLTAGLAAQHAPVRPPLPLPVPARAVAWAWRPVLLLALVPAAGAAPAAPRDAIDETVAPYFRPFQHDIAALAPDGQHLALGENDRGEVAAIVIVKIDDHSRQRFPLGKRPGTGLAVQQLLWVSPTRLAFTTRSRAVGTIDIVKGNSRALLQSKDLDGYLPDPELGMRRRLQGSTPDLSADSNRSPMLGGDFPEQRQVSFSELLAEARVSGDLFGEESVRDRGPLLRPFLLGPKPGAKDTVLVELRYDGDPLAHRQPSRTQVTVPGNAVVVDRTRDAIPPTERPANPELGYATYDIERALAPLVVLELELGRGRTRELAIEPDWRKVWLDQQGRLRLALEQRGGRFRYLYRDGSGGKWVPLDRVVKSDPPLGFEVGPENLLAPRSIPLGFDVNGKVLFIATGVGRETFGLRGLDLESGELVQEFEVARRQFDLIEPTALVAADVVQFDPHNQLLTGVRFGAARRETLWLNPDLAAIQSGLSKKFAPQRAEIRGWDAKRTRFLIELSSPSHPGGFAIFDPGARKFVHCGERAPWLTTELLSYTHGFDFNHEDGRRIAGSLTVPRKPRLNPPPVLFYFHDGPWFCDAPVFNRGAQALAALGFAVVQLNHRGSSGYGRAHLTAAPTALDRLVLEDVRAILARFSAGSLPLNTRLVATLGNGMGGYLAVRMVQLAPEAFRCAVAINAPGDLGEWRTHPDAAPSLWTEMRRHHFAAESAALRATSAVAAGKATRLPVLVVHAAENAYVPVALGRQLYGALAGTAPETAYLELPGEGHGGWSEETTARLFAELGRFFNATIYTFGVEVRAPEVVR